MLLVVKFASQMIDQAPITQTLSMTLSRRGGWFELSIGGQLFRQTTCEFMLTFSSMQGKDLEEYMSNLANDYDQVRVPLSGSGKSITVLLSDFVQLRALYGQQMFDLKLEDLLMRRGISTEETLLRQSARI